MLAVIRCLSPVKGLFANRRAQKGKIQLELVHKNVQAADFLEIFVTPGKKGVNYEVLAQKTASLSGRMVLQNFLVTSKNTLVNQYFADDYRSRLLLNGARSIIASAAGRKRLNVLIYDEHGRCPGAVAETVRAGADVTVITDHPDAFSYCAEYCLEEFGFRPTVASPDRFITSSFSAVIAPFGIDGMPYIKAGAIFSGKEEGECLCLDESCVGFPAELTEYCLSRRVHDDETVSLKEYRSPQAVPVFCMAAALSEEQGVRSLLELEPTQLVKGNKEYRLICDIAETVASFKI